APSAEWLKSEYALRSNATASAGRDRGCAPDAPARVADGPPPPTIRKTIIDLLRSLSFRDLAVMPLCKHRWRSVIAGCANAEKKARLFN
ncbi:MAG: hypothetical protein ABTQ30_13495, partial [Rhizobiaceae bacterium]